MGKVFTGHPPNSRGAIAMGTTVKKRYLNAEAAARKPDTATRTGIFDEPQW
jgi:hypothetical protein